ncbi:transposase [Streptomyces sp. DvalAA-43]|uniref:transposase n=1 Tax=Streptomyces sp. DvalAA-43 TaxID=1839762 RepID=UPI003521FC32
MAPCLPRNAGKTGHPFADHRRIIDGIIYQYRAGLPWRDLPRETFGPWQTARHNSYQRMPRVSSSARRSAWSLSARLRTLSSHVPSLTTTGPPAPS